MRNAIRSLVAVGALGLAVTIGAPRSTTAPTGPVKLSSAEMSKIVAGKIEQTNGGGNVPNGDANGVPSSNPAGHEPAGHNK